MITTREGREELRRLSKDLELSWTAPDGERGDIWFRTSGGMSFVTVPAPVIRLLDAMFDDDRALDGLDIAAEIVEAVQNKQHYRTLEALAEWDKWCS